MIAGALVALSFAYYSLLSSKTYTWLFASGDSGDWLACFQQWLVPQPYGSPLYIALGQFLNIFPGDLVIKSTILLSCLPAAITVGIVYLILKTYVDRKYAIIGSLSLIPAGVFLTQATILEEYSLAVMFVTLAFYFYINGRRSLTAISLGLGTAVHIIPLIISLLWFAVHLKEWKAWAKQIPLYILFGVAPYLLTLYLFTTDVPQLMAGGSLTFDAIDSYLGSTTVAFTIVPIEFPERALGFVTILLLSYGIMWYPAFKGLNPWTLTQKTLIVTIVFSFWYYLTCFDPTTWTFMIYAFPFISIFIGIGLSKLPKIHSNLALIFICLMMVVNGLFLNANIETNRNPQATMLYDKIIAIPDNVCIISPRGGPDFMATMYAYTSGKEFIPLYYSEGEYWNDALYQNYLTWVTNEYDIEGYNVQSLTKNALSRGYDVYIIAPIVPWWDGTFDTGEYVNPGLDGEHDIVRVYGVY